MDFLNQFPEAHARLFEGAAEALVVPKGTTLFRRGEPGGDIYLLQHGALDIVDTRSAPEVILASISEGSVFGEISFVDDSPGAADARTSAPSEFLRWARDDLRNLLYRHPDFAALFYESIAKIAARRIRSVTEGAVAGSFATRDATATAGAERAKDEARRLAESWKEQLVTVEGGLRHDPNDRAVLDRVRRLLDRLEAETARLFQVHPEPEIAAEAGKLLARELNPYLVRSSLAERCIRRPQGVTGTAEILAHVLVDTPGGDGQLGELIDRWLLDRPSLAAQRAFHRPIAELVDKLLPRHRNRRVLVVNAGTGSLVAAIVPRLARPPTVVTVVDQSRDALAVLDAGIDGQPRSVDLQTVQENLAQFAAGRTRHTFPPQDVVVLHGLVEYLPERIAVSLLAFAQTLLTPEGAVIATALAPSDDQALLDRLLCWPTIRRTGEALENVFRAGKLEVTERISLPPPALLLAGIPRTRVTTARPVARVAVPSDTE